MPKVITYLMLVILFFQTSCSSAFILPKAKITVKVVEENGDAVEGAKVCITFETQKTTSRGIQNVTIEGLTGSSGKITAEKETIDRVGFGVSKTGYYESMGVYRFIPVEKDKLQPWNPEVVVVLRKIESPTPMYARNTHMSPITIPEANKPIGFDLIMFDWLPPHGKGAHADFMFQLKGTFKSDDNYANKLELTFPNKFDGIQLFQEDRKFGSRLKLPKTAPETGYKNILIRSRVRVPGSAIVDDFREDNNYIFRIRSEEKNGKLVKAMYGKIHGDLRFDPESGGKASIIFKYYLNSTFSRNLEFDPQQNLFKNLADTERVGLE